MLSNTVLLACRVLGLRAPRQFKAAMEPNMTAEAKLEFVKAWTSRTVTSSDNLSKGDVKEGRAIIRHVEGAIFEVIGLGRSGVTWAEEDRIMTSDLMEAWAVASSRTGDSYVTNNVLRLGLVVGIWSGPAVWDRWTRRLSNKGTRFMWSLESTIWLEMAAVQGSRLARDKLVAVLQRYSLSDYKNLLIILLYLVTFPEQRCWLDWQR